MPRIERIRMLVRRQEFLHLPWVGQFHVTRDLCYEESVLANHLRQQNAWVFTDAISDQVIVERFLSVAGPAHYPAHVARRKRIRVLRSQISRRIERAVGNHHLYRHAASRDRRIKLVGKLHAYARTAGEYARAA